MRLVLVRHGEAAAGWADDADPGLSELGQQQARDIADRLVTLGPRPILTSPLLRCRETAALLADKWGVTPIVTERVGEIQAPDHDVATRGPWLREVLGQRWVDLPAGQRQWREDVLACLLEQPADCVVFTHFVAINVALGSATADGRVVCRTVANCSSTILDSDGASFTLVEAPAEVPRTEVL
jgi:broad specificity phosphatase PhoE